MLEIANLRNHIVPACNKTHWIQLMRYPFENLRKLLTPTHRHTQTKTHTHTHPHTHTHTGTHTHRVGTKQDYPSADMQDPGRGT
jgi:hypothetical protein